MIKFAIITAYSDASELSKWYDRCHVRAEYFSPKLPKLPIIIKGAIAWDRSPCWCFSNISM